MAGTSVRRDGVQAPDHSFGRRGLETGRHPHHLADYVYPQCSEACTGTKARIHLDGLNKCLCDQRVSGLHVSICYMIFELCLLCQTVAVPWVLLEMGERQLLRVSGEPLCLPEPIPPGPVRPETLIRPSLPSIFWGTHMLTRTF